MSIDEICRTFKKRASQYDRYSGNDTVWPGITVDSIKKVYVFDYKKQFEKYPDSIELYLDFYQKIESCYYDDCYHLNSTDVIWYADKHCNKKEIIYPFLIQSLWDDPMVSWFIDVNLENISNSDQKKKKKHIEKLYKLYEYLYQNHPDSVPEEYEVKYNLLINADFSRWQHLLKKHLEDS
ncbi:MAG: hypothetical protein NT150_06235, partial [Bacteroidetes bacterium]|nr:hypothetical protein [Bacteroidota bacterium]